MKTAGFHGSCAPAIASMRSSRLFVHSLLCVHGLRAPFMAKIAAVTGGWMCSLPVALRGLGTAAAAGAEGAP